MLSPLPLQLDDVRGRVDYGIITIRGDEFTAVLDRLPGRSTVTGERPFYEYARVPVDGGRGERGVAVVRCPSQGQGAAQSTAGRMIRQLRPRVLLLVGIAGGVPSDEFSLGDVLLASYLHDFSVTAALQDRAPQLNVAGSPLHKMVETLLNHLPALMHRMPDWNAPNSLRYTAPAVAIPADLGSDDLYGPDDWKKSVIRSLRQHFDPERPRRAPRAHVGPVASSNQLVKDADLAAQLKEAVRSVTHVEMEFAGVLQAARDAEGGEVPVLAVRGLSDIVGYRRDPGWTEYACHSAAALGLAMIRSGVIEDAAPWDWNAPGLMENKTRVVREWVGGVSSAAGDDAGPPPTAPIPAAKAAVPAAPLPGILILGPGGVGKSTLGALLSGEGDRSPFAAPPPYNESVSLERYALKRDSGPEAMVLVPPGQEHRRVREWDALLGELRDGRYHGVIFLAAYGYHSLGLIRWEEHPLAKKHKTRDEFLAAYLRRQRDEELSVLKEIAPSVRDRKGKLWMMTLVGKEDLWHEDPKVPKHYRTGAYGKQIRELEEVKGHGAFKHEPVFASLVISNFTSSAGQTLAPNRAGYDRTLQVKSLRRFIEVLDQLRLWERGE